MHLNFCRCVNQHINYMCLRLKKLSDIVDLVEGLVNPENFLAEKK